MILTRGLLETDMEAPTVAAGTTSEVGRLLPHAEPATAEALGGAVAGFRVVAVEGRVYVVVRDMEEMGVW